MNTRADVEDYAVDITDAAGRIVRVIGDERAAEAAVVLGTDLRGVYLQAMRAGIHPKRYLRNRDSISLAEQIRLAESSVVVVGAGGLGGNVIQQLARLGIGRLHIVDFDTFDETNLNRQILADANSMGKSKAETAAKMISIVNPAVGVSVYREKIAAGNAERILIHTDVVVDALDNVPDRFVIAAAARKLSLPLVHGAVAGFEGRVMTIFPEDAGLDQLYGEAPYAGPANPPAPEAILGTPMVSPVVVATFQVMEVIKIILKRDGLFRNRMVSIDLSTGQVDVFRFS